MTAPPKASEKKDAVDVSNKTTANISTVQMKSSAKVNVQQKKVPISLIKPLVKKHETVL